jgi:hypothetical protein
MSADTSSLNSYHDKQQARIEKFHMNSISTQHNSMFEECMPFVVGGENTKTFYSPGYPKTYANNITCVRVIEGMSFSSQG